MVVATRQFGVLADAGGFSLASVCGARRWPSWLVGSQRDDCLAIGTAGLRRVQGSGRLLMGMPQAG
jgi:hypothetical protein